VDFTNVPASANQRFTRFPTGYSTLPAVSFVVPNLCHDMHDCTVKTGDTWLKNNHRPKRDRPAGTPRDGYFGGTAVCTIVNTAVISGAYRSRQADRTVLGW
jgi:hypothetical protein